MSSIFEESTHRRFWLYGTDELKDLRAQALSGSSTEVDEGREGVRMNPSIDQSLQDQSNGYESKEVEEKVKKKHKASKLKGGDDAEYAMQEKVLRHFCRQIEVAMEAYKMKGSFDAIGRRWWRVAPTAIIYFRRFYIYNSLRVHDPRIMLLACLLVAGKTEESIVSMRDLKKIHPKLVDSQVLEAEFKLLKALGSQLHVYHPHNILQTMLGIVKSKHTVPDGKGVSVDVDFLELDATTTAAWASRAQALLDLLYITPAPLVFTPAALAYAVLILSESGAHERESVVAPAIMNSFPRDVDKALVAKAEVSTLTEAVPAIESFLSEARACVRGEENASVKAWVKLSKSAWPKSSSGRGGGGGGGVGALAKTEEEAEPPRKRIKEEPRE